MLDHLGGHFLVARLMHHLEVVVEETVATMRMVGYRILESDLLPLPLLMLALGDCESQCQRDSQDITRMSAILNGYWQCVDGCMGIWRMNRGVSHNVCKFV